ncbi:MAG: hypothetical protein R3336_01835, partial [Phycisphaeraceae bacterium]|nr:hypothetical protein [Phycisphaeraceae bacterium]
MTPPREGHRITGRIRSDREIREETVVWQFPPETTLEAALATPHDQLTELGYQPLKGPSSQEPGTHTRIWSRGSTDHA